jgi:putative hemolysin
MTPQRLSRLDVCMEEFIVVLLCLFLNALLAAYEMAFVTVSRGALRKLAQEGNSDAQALLLLRERPERTLSVIQIGITMVGAISSAVGGAGATESIAPFIHQTFGMSEQTSEFFAILAVVIPLTYLSVVVGELTPKSLALRYSLKITLLGAKALFIADRFLTPAVNLLEWSTKQVLRPFRARAPAHPPETTVDIEALPPDHQAAVLNLAHIERCRIRDVLVPWNEVSFVKTTDSMESIVPIIFATGHTRLPVVDENGYVIGFLHTKECLALREVGNKEWRTLIRPILVAHPQDPALPVFRQMQRNKSHMAVVRSGKEPLGIVTSQNIAEEIWGDIYDEDEDSRIRKVFADRIKRGLGPL